MRSNNFFLLYLLATASLATPMIYPVKFLAFNFFCANFLMPKSGHHSQNQPV